MKKLYVDLHLRPNIHETNNVRALVEKSAELGYSAIGLTFPVEVKKEDAQKIQGICREAGLDLVTRVDLTPKNSKDLLNILKRAREKFEVIAVSCHSKEVAIQAAKDHRVDLLSPTLSGLKHHFFSASEAKLACEKSAALEIDMAPLLYLNSFQRIRLMSTLRKDVSMAKKFNMPIILSSGAESPLLLRKPEDYAFLAYLIGLDSYAAKQALSINPKNMIERNRKRLSPNYICPGVRLVKGGEKCRSG